VSNFNRKRRFASGISASAVAVSLCFAQPAMAQTLSTLRGEHATAGATITVTDTVTGRDVTTTVGPDGTFVIVGLRPSTYRVVGAGQTQEVELPVGQTVTIDVAPPVAETPAGERAIIVTGRRNRNEVRSATVGTSVSQAQIENLPQNDRNFLNFAALAPGVTVLGAAGQNDKKIQAGGVSADNVNVYIDGTSHKNQVGFNGVAGQNFSQGNPFPQSAVQEFRVETQNFKAEYEQAGSAIITAVTKTGGNKFHGGAFVEFMPKAWFGRPFFDRPGEANNHGFPCADDPSNTCYNPKPDFKRYQFGVNLGGPIIPGKLHFFAAYEGTRQSNPPATFTIPEPFASRFLSGSPSTDFSQDLYFGKLTFFATDADTVHASYFLRKESDVRDFGGRELREHGRDLGTKTKNYQLEWNHRQTDWLNEFTIGYFDSFTGTPRITDAPEVKLTDGIDGQDLVIMGGHFFQQANQQQDYNFKDNLTYTGFSGHVIKAGVRYSKTKLIRTEDAFSLGSYAFDAATFTSFDASIPYRATVSLLPPTPMTAKNNMIGLFAQDDWTINDHLTLNYGLRWDYESNNFNQKYVTPDKVATALRNYQPWVAAGIDAEDYISNGHNRKPFKGAFQPRIGVSYDVNGDRDLILFAGAGRYYDRNNFYLASLERLFNNFRSDITVRFCGAAGLPACSVPGGNPAIGEFQFNPAFRDPNALRTAIGSFGLSGDIWVLNNKTPTPYTDQFNIGVRKRFGDWQTTATIAHNRSNNGFIFVRGNRMPDGSYTPAGFAFIRDNFPPEGRPAGYTGRVDIGSSKGKSHYTALYLQAEKPWTDISAWGVTAALTVSNAKSNQAREFGQAEMFNAGEQDAYGWQHITGLEKWRFVGSGIVGLPWGFRASTTVTLASGPRFGHVSFSNQPCGGCIPFNDAGVFSPKKNIAYKTVDLRLAKIFRTPWGHEVTADFQVYNVFDWVNRTYSIWGAGSGDNPTLKENGTTGNARSFQAGLKYTF
jgi:outer membrane receptor protein involved in Fe transport